MTEKKIGTIDPVAIRELISQGIPMKRKESEIKRSQSEEQFVESERPNDKPISKDFSRVSRRERRKADKGDYESLFIYRNTLKNRKTIYIAKELQDTLAEIVMSMRNRDTTIGIYVENIILHHLDTYKDEINRLAEMKFKKLLRVVSHWLFVSFEPYQLTVKSNEVLFIVRLCSPEVHVKKRVVGKSADHFTPSILLNDYF